MTFSNWQTTAIAEELLHNDQLATAFKAMADKVWEKAKEGQFGLSRSFNAQYELADLLFEHIVSLTSAGRFEIPLWRGLIVTCLRGVHWMELADASLRGICEYDPQP